MRFAAVMGACLLSSACGGDGGTDPTTNHHVSGDWTYQTALLQDGHSTTCGPRTPSSMTLTQQNVSFSGTVKDGDMNCTTGSVPWILGFGSTDVKSGKITGDSVTFDIDNGRWRSVGRFVTEDSMYGVLNGIYSSGGSQLILTGFWAARRQ